nr:hypothetical protein [Tanacetum cinerariifolium]
MLLAQVQEAGIALSKEQLAILADTGDRVDSLRDDTHKQALGYQNPFYLKKSQRIKPTLYDGSVISSQLVASHVIDDEKTLILEEVSRSKMLAKQNDPMSKEKKVNTTLINYVELNQLSKDFGKHFVLQQELSDEQAFWLQTSHPNTDQSASSPVKIEAPQELSKLKLENEHFLKHIICQDVVNIVMHADVKSDNVLHMQNNFLDDNIALDVLKMENDRLMKLLVSQDLVHIAVSSLAAINDYKSMEKSYFEEYERNKKLAAELSQMNELSKTCSRLEQWLFALAMLKLELEPLSPKLKNNKEAYVDYIKIDKENADTLRDIVEQAGTSNPLDNALAYAPALHEITSEQHGSRLGLHQLNPGYISSGPMQNSISPTPYVPSSKKDYEIPFQPLFNEYFNPPPRVVSLDSVDVAAPRAVDSVSSPLSTTIDQDVPSASTSPTN